MKYVFWGTPRFAEIVLDRLIKAGFPPAGLVCNPDRPVGRKKIVTPPPTKQRALKENETHAGSIRILQPEKLDDAFLHELKALAPDLFVVAAYAKMIPQAALAIPRLGTLGVHPSLLPKYRGASPIQSAILNGETETGVTLYMVDEKMDHGAIAAQASCDAGAGMIAYEALEATLAMQAAELLVKTIPKLAAGEIKPQAQDEAQATYTKKFTTEDAFVGEADLAAAESGDKKLSEKVVRMIHAFSPEPGAWTRKDGKRVKLLAATVANGRLKVSKIQEEGQKPKAI